MSSNVLDKALFLGGRLPLEWQFQRLPGPMTGPAKLRFAFQIRLGQWQFPNVCLR